MAVAPALDPVARTTAQSAPVRQVLDRLGRGEEVLVHGLPASLGAFLLTAAGRELERSILVVAADESRAEAWRDDLTAIAGEEVVRYFPMWDVDLYDGRSPDVEVFPPCASRPRRLWPPASRRSSSPPRRPCSPP